MAVVVVSVSLFAVGSAGERVMAQYGDITAEYPAGQERLACELARRFADYAEKFEARLTASPRAGADATVPLSAAEMRANRDDYLRRVAAQLDLERPTPLMEECYDEFLRNYALTMELVDQAVRRSRGLAKVRKFAIWPREDLVRRLEAGEKIAGISYDPVRGGKVEYGSNFDDLDGRLAGLTRRRDDLSRDYRMSVETVDGTATYRGSVRPKQRDAGETVAHSASVPPDRTDVFPVIIKAELAGLPPPELAERLFTSTAPGSVGGALRAITEMPDRFPVLDPKMAYLVLHETAELGVVDRYYGGRDRRWFCDGVANYVAWRVARDRHGDAVARTIYDLPAQLTRDAVWAGQADLRRWPAGEHQSADDRTSDLNTARYTFATNAIFLMHAKAGEDILPRLFREIGKTRKVKVSMTTIEKAWAKFSRIPLDVILADAVKTPPAGAN